jgi:hypothetical protein
VGAWPRVQIGAENDFDHGSKSGIDGTAGRLVATKTICKRGVQVKAAAANTGKVYVGNSDVTAGSADATDGFELSASQGLFVPAQDASTVYVVGSAGGQKVFWFTV